MPKRTANFNTSNARKRGRPGKRKPDGEGDAENEHDEDIMHQMRRRAIIDAKDDEEDWVRELEREEGGNFLEDIYIPPKITRTEHPHTGERMVIEKIVCENFKSYGGLKEMGVFHKSFSAIIGPNGNGKSNIIDAMLFVFGYRASKIRCKKVATLIHNSELLPNLKSCAVTVHFVKILDEGEKDQDDYRVVPGSQIAVKRRAFSDNSSKYYLNGKLVKFQEIAKFLKSNGVDLTHNRFLILQGEVEQIAQMPPIGSNGNDGLLEFLEEVIGTKRYILPLAQLEERVEKLDYERDEKLQRVDKAEKEKAALAEPVKKAKDYLRDQNAKTRYQSILTQKQIYQAKLKVIEKEAQRIELLEKMKTLQTRLDEILGINQERLQELHDAEKEFKTAEREYNKVKKKFDAADAEFIQLSQELQRTNETRKKLQKEKAKLEAEIEKLSLIPKTHKGAIEELTKRKLELDTSIENEELACKKDLEKLNIKVEEALKMKEITDRQFAEQKALRDEKKASIEKLEKQLANSKEREVIEKKKLNELKAELETLKVSIGRKEKESRTSLGSGEIASLETKAQKLARDEHELQQTENEKRAVFEAARDEYQIAQESADGNSQLDKVDRALLEAKADGTLPGLYGRMKNLAKLPEKYNIAATVASGMLDHWVTDNDNTAGECIKFLRANNLPVQTFLCLTRIQSYVRQAQERFDTPDQSHRIFDLLEIKDPNLRPAYFKAFRNTLVADNIDIATKVSYGSTRRHRVCTLKGEIVEPTGSLCGGGNQRMYGKFNSKNAGVTVTKQQLSNLRERHDAALKEYQKAQEAKQNIAANLRKISQEIEDIKKKQNNFTSDMAALKAQIPLKEKNIETQKRKLSECTLSENGLEEKEGNLEQEKEDFEALLEPFEEAQENATRINHKVQDLQVIQKKEITKKLDKFKEQAKKVNEELNKKIVELKNCDSNRAKSEKKLETIEKEIDNLEKAMLKKNERKKAVEAEAKAIKEKEESLVAGVQEAKTKFEEMKGQSHEFEKEEKTLSKNKLSLENGLADATNQLKGCQNFLRTHKDFQDKLELHDIPEEESLPLKQFTDDEIKAYSSTELERKVKKYTDKIKSRPMPNLNILEEYRHKLETLLERIKELDAITVQRDTFREAYCLLDQQRSTEFMEGFALISSRLKEMFRMISMGGDAELEVVDTLDLFGCGINFSVRPARKTWKKISNLSGGEKTLSSLSLVFALHHFKPSPFYVMDEIDAALDFKNVSIIANYIKDRTKFTQFIIISLRSNMFELADSLLGVYKVDNMSYCIHIGVKKMVQELKRRYENKANGNGVALSQGQPLKESQGQSQPPPAVAGSSKAMMEQLNKDKQQLLANNLSAIVDQDAGNEENQSQTESPKSNSQQEEPSFADRTVVERFEDNIFTPPARISNTPSAKSAQAEKQSGSEDLFADMDTSGSQPFKNIAPMASSTPFIGKRASTYQDRIQPRQGSASDSDDDDKTVNKTAENEEEEVFPNAMNISPIKRVGLNAGVPPSPAFSEVPQNEVDNEDDLDDSFKTADGSSDEVEQFGPSQ